MRARLAALGRPGIAASTFHAAALRQLRHFWPRVTGADLPAVLETKVPMLVDLARGLPGGYRYVAVRDLAGEIEWAKARRVSPADVRGGGPGVRPRRSPPGAPLRAALPALRGGQGAGRPDRLRGHARDDRAPARGRAGDRRRGPGPLPLVQRRRVPGHERPPAGAPRRLARRARGPGRRRRRGPDDLHVHRSLVGVADRVHRALSHGPGDPARDQLPVEPAGHRARQPAPCPDPSGRGWPAEAAGRDPTRRSAPDDPPVRDGGRGGAVDRGRGAPAHRGGRRARGDRRPGPDERPARRVRGSVPRGRRPVPAPG